VDFDPGSARASRAGFGVLAKTVFHHAAPALYEHRIVSTLARIAL
jgi:hypothetical protein